MLASNMIGSIWSPWRNKRGATATITKMVQRQHIRKWCHGSISVPIAHGDTSAKRKHADLRNMLDMVEGSRLPGSHGLVAWKRVTIRTRCRQRVHLIQHAFIRSRASSRGYTFEVRLFRMDQVLSGSRQSRHVHRGSSCTHAVVEVIVLSFICDHRDGSRNRATRRLVETHGGGSCTHVVVELDGTNVLEVVVVLVAFRNRSGTWQYPRRS